MSLEINGSDSPSPSFPLNAEDKDALLTHSHTLGITNAQRHVFLCADPASPKCCSREMGQASWSYLKRRMKELNLDEPSISRGAVLRTKANCLRVCQQGPILVVYPDGVWYGRAYPEVIEQIIQEHLIGNRVVQGYVFSVRPLR